MLLAKSTIKEIGWPAIPSAQGAASLALQLQLEHSQWWSAQAIAQQQFRQLSALLLHAAATVPFYRERLQSAGYDPVRESITPARWRTLPRLRREDIQSAGDALMSGRVPAAHGRLFEHFTSGSTGRPIHAYGTELTHFFWLGLTLRDHLWHKRDLSGKLASIRSKVSEEPRQGWGPATDAAFASGPSVTLNIQADLDSQLQWLIQHNPDYLLSHPSNLAALARHCIERHIRLPRLREVRSFGEALGPDLRRLCREAWNVPLVDSYSTEEVGYIALQCPEHQHYHVQAENLLVEVLDDQGQPCPPGEIGKVVVTTLHNFAMPLLRYEIGDYAEVGEPCPCGRGLPVLKRIMGRQRNLVTLPDGRQHWPSFPGSLWLSVAPIRQFQLVQKSLQQIEVRIVADRPLTADEETRLGALLNQQFGYPFHLVFNHVGQIERKPNCKFEDFISELAHPEQGA
ncbi:MAG: phenylacetate--CoA ligase family protein [Nitrosomonadales bacterium]|nr:phenylacetate--CoA ligase family protein [Nitrosomonadales bacterium]